MTKQEELYLGGTTNAHTLKPFLFHVVMMFLLPLLSFFFARDMLKSYGHSERDQNIYAGFISLGFVILVIVSYVLNILSDQDNWVPTEQEKFKASKKAGIEIQDLKKDKDGNKITQRQESIEKLESKQPNSKKQKKNKNNQENKATLEEEESQDKENNLRKRDVQSMKGKDTTILAEENEDVNKIAQTNQKNKKKDGSKNSKKKSNKSQKA